MTLNGSMALVLALFYLPNMVDLRPITSKWSNTDLYCLRQKYTRKNVVFSNISFMAIFAEGTENECIVERHVCTIDPLRDPLRGAIGPDQCCLHDRYGWLRPEVSKQISCWVSSVLISPQSIIVLEKP